VVRLTGGTERTGPGPMSGRARLVLWTAAAMAVVAPAIAWRWLPDRLAVQWGLSGRPEEELARPGAVALLSGLVLAAAVAAAVAGRARAASPGRLAVHVAAVFLASVLAAAEAVVLVANAAAGSAARVSPAWALPMLGYGVLAVLFARPRPATPHSVRLAAGARAHGRELWRGGVRSSFAAPTAASFGGLAAVLFGIAAAVGAVWAVITGIGVLVAAVFVLSVVAIQVVVDAEALRVGYYGRLGRPATVVPLRAVETVEAIHVDPAQYGGWGYRGSVRLFGRAAVNLRRGPGLRLRLVGGRLFVVTVDDAQGAARALGPAVNAARGRAAAEDGR
jgi:hypothetical protein